MAVDAVRKVISNNTPVSPTTISGWPSVILSLPLISVGVFIILLALNIIPLSDSNFHASRQIIAAFGSIFFVAGIGTFVHGIQSLGLQAKRNEIIRQHPGQPWLADFSWNFKGISGDSSKKAIGTFGGVIAMSLFLIPFNWLVFSTKNIPGIFRGFIVLFDVFLFLGALYGIYLLLRFLKYGDGYLQFNQFPFFLGDQVNATMACKALKGIKDMVVTLRCIEEQYETRGSGKNRHTVVISYQLYADTVKVENAGGGQYNRFYLPVTFPLPQDKNLQTALSARPAKYWQIEFKAVTPGIDYLTSFLVPVYSKND